MQGTDSALFKSTDEQNFLKFAGEIGQCFYVPAYQRYYVWKEPDVDRFFLDIANGMNELYAGRQEVTFIGTLTCFRDVNYETIEPKVRKDVPASVINIVDGQQRVTTLMVTALLLHDYIRIQAKDCSSEWLRDTIATEHLNQLMRTFEMDKVTGTENIYPKMIRAFDDQWSVDPDELVYSSPLSHLIYKYGKHYRTQKKEFKITPSKFSLPRNLTEEQIKAHKNFLALVAKIRKYILSICNEGEFISQAENAEDNVKLPSVKEFLINSIILKDICNLDTIEDTDVSLLDQNQKKLFRAFFLSSYVLSRIHFVSLIAPQEKQVYDIFDALNTTGQTLTAIETFKPEVILFEGLAKYNGSESHKHFRLIDEYLGTLSTNAMTKKVSNEIVTAFAYAENGIRIGGHLGQQRGYLKKYFNKVRGNIEQGRNFVSHLRCVSQVVQHYWYDTGDNLSELLPHTSSWDDELFSDLPCVQLCLKYLNAAGHKICRPLIARFHHQIAESPNKQVAVRELFDVIKAIAAFFAIWRSTRMTTDRIDDWYREIYSKELLSVDLPFFPVNRKYAIKMGATSCSSCVKNSFRTILSENNKGSNIKIPECAKFMEVSYFVPIYRTQGATAKFLLLVSSHDAVPDGSNPGLLIDGKKGVNPMLSGDKWDDVNYQTVEHIIPQSMAGQLFDKGDPALDTEMLNRIGNLTLLPKKVNSILSRRSQDVKELIYKAICSETEEEAKRILGQITPPLSTESINLIVKLRISRMLASLVLASDFGHLNIEPRSNNISERAWKILYDEWLSDN